MMLNLDPNGTLRMAGAHGMTVEVLDGHVWLTQTGRSEDLILARGARYSVEGDGFVMVGLDKRARLDVCAGEKPPLWRRLLRPLAAWRKAIELRAAVRELQGYSDHRLRDLGISRDQIRDAVYNRFNR